HTLRRSQSQFTRHAFPDGFSNQLDEAWQAGQPPSAFFANELYITIVKAGKPAQLRNLQQLLTTLKPGQNKAARTAELERFARELTATTQTMLSALQPYGARLLSVVEREGVYYGEHLEFLEKLI